MKNISKEDNCQTEESLNSDCTASSLSHIEEKKALVSFQKFVSYIKYNDILPVLKWKSQLKEDSYRMFINKKRIILKELQQIDYKDPLTIISSLYQRDNYSIELFDNSIRKTPNLKSNETVIKVIEERENLEMMRKIIEYYLHYITMNCSDKMINGFNKLHQLELSVVESHNVIQFNSNKMSLIKKHFIETSAKLTLNKCKIANIKKTIKFVRDILLVPIGQINKLKIEYFSYMKYYNNNKELENSLDQLISVFPNLKILTVLKGKCLEREKEIFGLCSGDINRLFEEKKSNIYDLFCLYNIKHNVELCEDSVNSFVDVITKQFKLETKKVITKTCYSKANNSLNESYDNIEKIKDITHLKFEEVSFVECVKVMLIKLKYLIEIYISYSEIPEHTEMASILGRKIKENQSQIYTVLEKKLSNFISSIGSILRNFSNKTPSLITVSMICLFEELIKGKISIDYSKYLPLAVKNLIIDNIKFTNIKNILKIGILLSGDIWEKHDLEDEIDLFSMKKIGETNPLFLRNYLTIFNDSTEYVNPSNIVELFDKCFDINTNTIETQVNLESFLIETNFSYTILSKPLNISKMILSTSSINLFKAINTLIEELLFYDGIAFEIFYEIFTIVDYFMFASLNMFIRNKMFLITLIEKLNFEEIKLKKSPTTPFIQAKFQSSYPNLRRFFILTKKKLEILFQQKEEIDLQKSCLHFENSFDIKEFSLPKLNSVLLNSMVDGSTNQANMVYNAVISIGTVHSVYKIIKRLSHFSSKIDLDFQSAFIVNTINQYKIIIVEMKRFLYNYLSSELFKIDSIQSLIINFNWDSTESDAEKQLFEISPFVEEIVAQLKAIHSNLEKISNLRLTIQKHFYTILLTYIIDNIMDAFAKVKRCNEIGRSLMLKDLKFLKMGIEDVVNNEWGYGINVHSIFQSIYTYINAWYYSKDDIFIYISENKIEYKHWSGFLNTSPSIKQLSRGQKKEFIQKVEEFYYDLLYKELEGLNNK